jgi:outer membrane protein TolC
MRAAGIALAALAALSVTGCVRYQARPIDLAAHPGEYRTRRLDDTALVHWVTEWGGAPSSAGWTDRQLAVAALRLRAEIARARAEWRAVRAGEGAAAARPAPGLSTDVEHAVSGNDGQAPWVVSLAGLFSIELGGKRAARLQEARARTAGAEAALTAQAWHIALETRRAALDLTLADTGRAAAATEVVAVDTVLALERQRFAEAAVTASEVARASADLADVRGTLAAAERQAIEARASLAAAIGVTPRAMESVAVLPVVSPACDWIETLGVDSVEGRALTLRPEMAHSLAEYAATEGSLRLQIARQYPDLDLGPGFIWDQGVHRWTLAFALPGLLGFRNRSPIVQAEAERAAAGARVLETQESVIREVATAAESCRGARLERVAADSQVAGARRNLARAQAAYERGETARLDAALARLALVRAERVLRDADRRLALAGLAVEEAAGEWKGGGAMRWPDPRTESGEEGASR